MNTLIKVFVTAILCATAAQAQKIVIVGDSTVASYDSGSKQGWGAYFGKELVSGAKVVNLARGGRSTKTYISEGLWKNAVSQRGKYVFIQFGHNDQSKRHTNPDTTYKKNLRRMIADVKSYGGVPVIVSPTRRLRFENSNRMSSELSPYAVSAREVAAEEKVPFVNLHEASKNEYLDLGESNALKYFASGDRTHTNSKGAKLLASLVAEECLKNSRLKKLIR
jgi:lysophospholipase L1-like esterase